MRKNFLLTMAAGIAAALSGERKQVSELSPLPNLGEVPVTNILGSTPNRMRVSYGIGEMSRHKAKMKCRIYCAPKKRKK